MILDSRGLDIAEEEEKMFVFAISLLDATIQDGGISERSNEVASLFEIIKNLFYYFLISFTRYLCKVQKNLNCIGNVWLYIYNCIH